LRRVADFNRGCSGQVRRGCSPWLRLAGLAAIGIGGRAVSEGNYVAQRSLKLYIAGNSAASRRAEQNLVHLKTLVPGWEIEVIDVLTAPELAERAGILATPTLAYEHPERPRRVIGDLSNARRVLEFLAIESCGGDEA
jgi:circadian clock protein KaiB